MLNFHSQERGDRDDYRQKENIADSYMNERMNTIGDRDQYKRR
jgi:hypothetical protein